MLETKKIIDKVHELTVSIEIEGKMYTLSRKLALSDTKDAVKYENVLLRDLLDNYAISHEKLWLPGDPLGYVNEMPYYKEKNGEPYFGEEKGMQIVAYLPVFGYTENGEPIFGYDGEKPILTPPKRADEYADEKFE